MDVSVGTCENSFKLKVSPPLLTHTVCCVPPPAGPNLFVCLSTTAALLISLYEQLLELMKLGSMSRSSSRCYKAHSSLFDTLLTWVQGR